MAGEKKLGNPAVVGLAGFGMTTLCLQFHNLGLVGIGPVLWIGLLFGGTAQLVAGLLEFGTGNNFGFCAFTGYGAFWISLCFYLIFGTNAELVKAYPGSRLLRPRPGHLPADVDLLHLHPLHRLDEAPRHPGVIFLTLLLGFIGLDLKELAGTQRAGTLAAWDLIVCALLAWYLMAVAIYAESGINLPVGKPWISTAPQGAKEAQPAS